MATYVTEAAVDAAAALITQGDESEELDRAARIIVRRFVEAAAPHIGAEAIRQAVADAWMPDPDVYAEGEQ